MIGSLQDLFNLHTASADEVKPAENEQAEEEPVVSVDELSEVFSNVV
jgi:hypothetical protein